MYIIEERERKYVSTVLLDQNVYIQFQLESLEKSFNVTKLLEISFFNRYKKVKEYIQEYIYIISDLKKKE